MSASACTHSVRDVVVNDTNDDDDDSSICKVHTHYRI